MAKNKCEICCRPTGSGHITCGLSECQEASYYANLARNARGKKQGPAIRLATEKAATARYWAGRRGALA